jgi:hypothetical protein
MRRLVLPGSLLLAVAAAACGGGGDETAEESPDGSPLQPLATREWAGVRLTLSVDNEKYEVGDPVKVRAEAENIRGEQLVFRPVSPEFPLLRLAVESPLNGTQEFIGGETEGGEDNILPAGGKLVREYEWDQQLATYQTPVQAPEAAYEISAQVIVSPDETSNPDAVATEVRFKLEGGEPVLEPDLAIETVLYQEEVKRWFENHPATLVCADGNRDRFYLVEATVPRIEEVVSDIYQSQVERGRPVCSPVTDGDTWRVIFSAPQGPPPARISAFVDLNDGTFLRVEEGGPGSTPGS